MESKIKQEFKLSNLGLKLKKDIPVVSSRIIADGLGKQHNNVLRDIENIIKDLKNKENSDLNFLFIESKYSVESQKRKYKEYLLTEDGFLLYIFNIQGYNEFKLDFIKEFRRLQKIIEERNSKEWLQTRLNGKLVRKNETDMIALLIKYVIEKHSCSNTRFFYSNYTKLINRPLNLGNGQREYLDFFTLVKIGQAENIIQNEIKSGMENNLHYSVIYNNCKEKIKQFFELVGTDVKFINGGKLIEE